MNPIAPNQRDWKLECSLDLPPWTWVLIMRRLGMYSGGSLKTYWAGGPELEKLWQDDDNNTWVLDSAWNNFKQNLLGLLVYPSCAMLPRFNAWTTGCSWSRSGPGETSGSLPNLLAWMPNVGECGDGGNVETSIFWTWYLFRGLEGRLGRTWMESDLESQEEVELVPIVVACNIAENIESKPEQRPPWFMQILMIRAIW